MSLKPVDRSPVRSTKAALDGSLLRGLRIVIGLIGALAVLIGAARLIGQGATDPAACLRFEDQFLNVGTIDVQSGTTVGFSAARLSAQQQTQRDEVYNNARNSPNGRFVAYRFYPGDPSSIMLFLRPAMTTNYHQSGRQLGTVLHDSNGNNDLWSPDSRWLAYLHVDSTDQTTLRITTTTGDVQGTYPIKTSTDTSLRFHGWSADSHYLALSVAQSGNTTYHLYVWSLPALTLVAVRTYVRPRIGTDNVYLYPDSMATWSPSGHQLVYFTQPGSVPQLTLMSPGGADIAYDLPGADLLVDPSANPDELPAFTWSPDGAHLAITIRGKRGYYLDLLRMDGSPPLLLSNTVVEGYTYGYSPGFYSPQIAWSPDSQSLFYVDNGASSGDNVPGNFLDSLGDFRAYRLRTQRFDVLATRVFRNLQQTPDHTYAFAAWLEGKQIYTGVIRTADGKMLGARAYPEGDAELHTPDLFISWAVKNKSLLLDIGSYTAETWLLDVNTGISRPVKDWGTVSPDGIWQAHVTTKPGSPGTLALDKLHIESLDSTRARDIPLKFGETDSAHPTISLVWSSDSKYIAVVNDQSYLGKYDVQVVTLTAGAIDFYQADNFYPISYAFGACQKP